MMKLCVLLLLAIVLAQAANHVSAYRKHKCSVKDIQDAKNVIKNVGNCTTEQGKNAFRTLTQCGENGQELRLLCSKSLNTKAPQPKSGGVKQNATGSKSKTINGDPRLPKSQGKPVPTHPSECVQNVKAVSLETKSKVGIQCPAAKITGLLNSLKKPGRCSSEDGLAAVKSLLTCGKSQADLQKLCGPKFHFDFGGNRKGSGSGIPCTAAKITGLLNSLKKPGHCSSKVGRAAVKSLLTCGKSQADLQKLCDPKFHFDFGGNQKGSGSGIPCTAAKITGLLNSLKKPGHCSSRVGRAAVKLLLTCGKSQADLQKLCDPKFHFDFGGNRKGSGSGIQCRAAKIKGLLNSLKNPESCSSEDGLAAVKSLLTCGKSQADLQKLCGPKFHFDFGGNRKGSGSGIQCPAAEITDLLNSLKKPGRCSSRVGRAAVKSLLTCGKSQADLQKLCDPKFHFDFGGNRKGSGSGIPCTAAKITGLLNSLKKPGHCSSKVGRAAVKSLLTCGKSQADLQKLCDPKFHFDFGGNRKGSVSGIPCTAAKITGLLNSLKKPGHCSSKVGRAAVKSLLTCGKSQADLQNLCGPKFHFDFGGNRKGSGSGIQCPAAEITGLLNSLKKPGRCSSKVGRAAVKSLLTCGKSQADLQKHCGPKFHFDFGGNRKGSGSGIQCPAAEITGLLNSLKKPGRCSSEDGLAAVKSLLTCGKSQADLQKLCGPKFHFDFGGNRKGSESGIQCRAAKIKGLLNSLKNPESCSSEDGLAAVKSLLTCGKSQADLQKLCGPKFHFDFVGNRKGSGSGIQCPAAEITGLLNSLKKPGRCSSKVGRAAVKSLLICGKSQADLQKLCDPKFHFDFGGNRKGSGSGIQCPAAKITGLLNSLTKPGRCSSKVGRAAVKSLLTCGKSQADLQKLCDPKFHFDFGGNQKGSGSGIPCTAAKITGLLNSLKKPGHCSSKVGRAAVKSLLTCGKSQADLQKLCDPKFHFDFGGNRKGSGSGIPCTAAKITGLLNSLKKPGHCSSKVGRAAVKSLLICGKSQADLQKLCDPKFHFDFGGNRKGSGSYLQKLCGPNFHFDFGGSQKGSGSKPECKTDSVAKLLKSIQKPGSCSTKEGKEALQTLFNCGKSQAEITKICSENSPMEMALPAPCPAAKIDSLMNKMKKLNDCSSAEGKAVRQELINCGKSQEELNSLCHNFWKGVGNFIRNPFGIFGK